MQSEVIRCIVRSGVGCFEIEDIHGDDIRLNK